MQIYIYKAKKGPRAVVQGEVEADSEKQAVEKVDAMGLVAVSVTKKTDQGVPGKKADMPKKHERHSILSSATLGVRFPRIKTGDIDTFTRQLASLVKASVPMLQSLSLISQQSESRALSNLVKDLEKQVKEGSMLSEAMGKYPSTFDNLYLNMVKSGEKSGALDEVLTKLAEYREKQEETRKKIQAAMAYPLLMIIVGIGTVFVMLTYFLPKLTVLFENMGQALPLPTKILMGISYFMSHNWLWVILALVFLAALLGRIKPGSKKKLIMDIIKLRIPIVRKLERNSEIAKFSRTLAMLLKNGVPISDGLVLATDALSNEALKEPLLRAGNNIISQGASLSNCLRAVSIFPKFAINMITVGEEGGRLEESLTEIAAMYEREVEQALKITTALLEPLLILIVGSVVGFIVFAMLLPIFNIGVMPQ
ncbi:MAG: type II secretion system F family protein [Candidatus Omnitrophica bacterium]|nr:type II secretion system F family protein [Candidatus Omnitrophota bacterium]